MPDNSKREKVTLLILANPERPWHELCIEAGYSKKRARVTASELRRDANFQAKLAAIRGKQLASAPTLETYHTLLNSASEAALRGDPNAWILLQCAQAHGKEALGQEPKAEQSRAVLVKFVESELPPEQVQTVNKFLGQFEASAGFSQGWSGRLMPEPQVIQAQCSPLKPVPQAKPMEDEGAVLLLPISHAERQRLGRVCMPVGGALQTRDCRAHGAYECIWQQSASGEWGWSDCPACWQKVN